MGIKITGGGVPPVTPKEGLGSQLPPREQGRPAAGETNGAAETGKETRKAISQTGFEGAAPAEESLKELRRKLAEAQASGRPIEQIETLKYLVGQAEGRERRDAAAVITQAGNGRGKIGGQSEGFMDKLAKFLRGK